MTKSTNTGQQRKRLPFARVEKDFEDEYAACTWIMENQTGRRNRTNAWRMFHIGEQYKLKMKQHGENKNPEGAKSIRQNGGLINETAIIVAEKQDVMPTFALAATDIRAAKSKPVG